jgi:hypothetical protein
MLTAIKNLLLKSEDASCLIVTQSRDRFVTYGDRLAGPIPEG